MSVAPGPALQSAIGRPELATAALFLFALVFPRFPGNMGVLAGAVGVMWLEFVLVHAGVLLAACKGRAILMAGLLVVYLLLALIAGLGFGAGIAMTLLYLYLLLRRLFRLGALVEVEPALQKRAMATAVAWLLLGLLVHGMSSLLPELGVDNKILWELQEGRRYETQWGAERAAAYFCVLWFLGLGLFGTLESAAPQPAEKA